MQRHWFGPHLEYTATVWSPHTSDNIKKVAMQRRAAKYVQNYTCTELHIHQRRRPGRGGWHHPPDKHIGSIYGGIFHWARPMTHTNSHSYLPSSQYRTTSHLTLSPSPPWTPPADNSQTCKRQGFLTSPITFTAPFFPNCCPTRITMLCYSCYYHCRFWKLDHNI